METTPVTPKYGISDVLKPRIDSTGLVKLQVVGIRTNTCYTATQVTYECRVYTKRFVDSGAPAIGSILFAFSEPEVEYHPDFAKATGKKE